MASTTALFTGLSGLLANARQLDVIGNNIANVNTQAFKGSRMAFAPAFSRNFSFGTGPTADTGGSNPSQIGLGVVVAGVQRNFAGGSIQGTGILTDLALEGEGMFIVEQASERFFTRSGAFERNERNELVTIDGARLQGFGVDAQFNVVQGVLQDLNIPVGTLTLAEATRNVVMNGNLNASGNVPTSGSVHDTRAFFTDAILTVPMTGAEDLTAIGIDLYIDDGAGGSVTIRASESVELNGVDPNDPERASAVAVSTTGAGNAGNIVVRTPEITIEDGARVIAESDASGAAGSIFIGNDNAPVGRLHLSNAG